MTRGILAYCAGCFTVALLIASPETHRYLGMALLACFAVLVILRDRPVRPSRTRRESSEGREV